MKHFKAAKVREELEKLVRAVCWIERFRYKKVLSEGECKKQTENIAGIVEGKILALLENAEEGGFNKGLDSASNEADLSGQ